MMYKQAMKVPVLLLIVGVTFMLCEQVSASCSCSGYVPINGRGECKTSYMGKKFCYVNPGQCSDQIKSSFSSRFWSYQACEKMETQSLASCPRNPVIKGLSRNCCTEENPCEEGEGDCDTNNQDTCQSGLRCGDSNCGDFNPDNYAQADCCYKPMIEGQDYNFNEDGSINCQTREDCPPGYDVDYGARVSYSCGGYINDTWIQDICVDQKGRGITCGNGKRAKDCGDCGTTEEECGGGDCLILQSNCVRVLTTDASVAYPLTQNSAIGGTGIRTLTAPDRYVACGPHYCRRGDKCCLLVNIGWSNSYLGCPQYC